MDILKKMFKPKDGEGRQDRGVSGKDEFRKPQWFEESETDDELFDDDRKFAFQIFTNPMELQKHFERQMQQFLEAMSDLEDNGVPVEKNLKEEYLKPGFESKILKEFEKHKKQYFDTDLDGEIFADELHSLIQRLTPKDSSDELVREEQQPPTGNILPRNHNKSMGNWQTKRKLSDEEIIMGKIHGTLVDEEQANRKRSGPLIPRLRPDIMTPMTPMIPRGPFHGGVFDGNYQGPRMFSQSVMTKTIRKPDGSYETTKITRDSEGNKTTTVTRTIDGKTETVTTYDDATAGSSASKEKREAAKTESDIYSDRNIYVSKEGYALPRNLW